MSRICGANLGSVVRAANMHGLHTGSGKSAWTVAAMLAIVGIPAGITLHTVRVPASVQITADNPTPYGYTVSLLMFLVPVIVIAGWFLPAEKVTIARRAFWWTIGILVPIGFALDFFFANRFFTFANRKATLEVIAPALHGGVPIEEYLFYLTGFLAVLLLYVWLDAYWLEAYSASQSDLPAGDLPRVLRFHGASLVVGAGMVIAAVIYKKLRSPWPDGLPEYFIVLSAGSLIPSAGFFHTARRFINWRAFSLTIFIVLWISMFWEATLAVPYGWWGYQQSRMIGLSIGAWANLPLEAVVVWLAVTYSTTITFEVIRLWQASGRPARQVFLGKRNGRS